MRGGASTFVSWFLAGVATSLAGGLVYAWTRNPSSAVITGVVVLVVLRLAQAGGG
ncbi:MAG TPA: hypothetical protein VIU86_16655 [Gaiellaceae bacterium]|jgi:hypothetical protein